MTLHNNCTGAMQRRRQQKIREVLVKRKFPNCFFFCQTRRAFFFDALLLCLFGGERQDSVLRPFLTSPPLSVAKADVSEITNRLPDYFTLKNNSHEAWKCSVKDNVRAGGLFWRNDRGAKNVWLYATLSLCSVRCEASKCGRGSVEQLWSLLSHDSKACFFLVTLLIMNHDNSTSLQRKQLVRLFDR